MREPRKRHRFACQFFLTASWQAARCALCVRLCSSKRVRISSRFLPFLQDLCAHEGQLWNRHQSVPGDVEIDLLKLHVILGPFADIKIGKSDIDDLALFPGSGKPSCARFCRL